MMRLQTFKRLYVMTKTLHLKITQLEMTAGRKLEVLHVFLSSLYSGGLLVLALIGHIVRVRALATFECDSGRPLT